MWLDYNFDSIATQISAGLAAAGSARVSYRQPHHCDGSSRALIRRPVTSAALMRT
jgi:hypothetical protein